MTSSAWLSFSIVSTAEKVVSGSVFLFNRYLFSPCHVPGTGLGVVNQPDTMQSSRSFRPTGGARKLGLQVIQCFDGRGARQGSGGLSRGRLKTLWGQGGRLFTGHSEEFGLYLRGRAASGGWRFFVYISV